MPGHVPGIHPTPSANAGSEMESGNRRLAGGGLFTMSKSTAPRAPVARSAFRSGQPAAAWPNNRANC